MIQGELAVRVRDTDTIDFTVRSMARHASRVRHVGIAVVLDGADRVVGVVTDGDIRRAYASDIPFSEPVARVMSPDPISVPASMPVESVPGEVLRRIRRGGRLKADIVRHVLVTDLEGMLVGIYDSLNLFAFADRRHHNVAVYGTGPLGLTLSAALAAQGHEVTVGVGREEIERLGGGISGLNEPDLDEALNRGIEAGRIRFVSPKEAGGDEHIHVLALEIGPDSTGNADLNPLRALASALGKRLRSGDTVILCSPAPVGTTRHVLGETLQKVSGLRAGADFCLAHTPAAFVPGAALAELQSAARNIGGLTARCSGRAAAFWNMLTPFVNTLPSLEATEIAGLAGPAFRDLNIAFANELLLVADRHNINVHRLIAASESGIPGAPIPGLSPASVGAPASMQARMLGLRLTEYAAQVQGDLADYPALVVARFAERRRMALKELRVLILAAGARSPAERAAVEAAAGKLNAFGATSAVWNPDGPAAPPGTAVAASDVPAAIADADAILVLTQDRRNLAWDLSAGNGGVHLVFDGMAQIDRIKIEAEPGFVYATFGYMTPPRCAVIACDNGFGHVRRSAAVAAALRERGARCDLFVPGDASTRLDMPTIAFRTHSTPQGWRSGARETVAWPERLPNLEAYDFVISDSLPEILARRPDAILLGHFLWTFVLHDADSTHARQVDAWLAAHRPRMLGTGLLASEQLKSATRYEDVGIFADNEIGLCPSQRTELLVSIGLGAEPAATDALRAVIERLSRRETPPAPFTLVHVEPGLLPPQPPAWMVPASYDPAMYRRLVAAIVRPGAGTVTDCLARAVWIVWPQAVDHEEIGHNVRALQAAGLGELAEDADAALERASRFASDPKRIEALRARCSGLSFGAAGRVADLVIKRGRPSAVLQ